MWTSDGCCLNWAVDQFVSGQYQFTRALTDNPQQPAGTGFGAATFLLGEVSGGQLQMPPFYSFDSWTIGLFVQDDVKVTPRLTLNLGLRYDLASSPSERWNRHSNFDPFKTNPETGMLGVLEYSGINAPERFVDRDYNNFGHGSGSPGIRRATESRSYEGATESCICSQVPATRRETRPTRSDSVV